MARTPKGRPAGWSKRAIDWQTSPTPNIAYIMTE